MWVRAHVRAWGCVRTCVCKCEYECCSSQALHQAYQVVHAVVQSQECTWKADTAAVGDIKSKHLPSFEILVRAHPMHLGRGALAANWAMPCLCIGPCV